MTLKRRAGWHRRRGMKICVGSRFDLLFPLSIPGGEPLLGVSGYHYHDKARAAARRAALPPGRLHPGHRAAGKHNRE